MSLSTFLATVAGKTVAGTAIAVLAAGGVAAADAVDLPGQAEDAPVVSDEHRRDAEHRRDGDVDETEETGDVEETEVEETETEEGPSAEGLESSAFGQCVSAAAAELGEPEEGEARGEDFENPSEQCAEDHPGQDGQAIAAEKQAAAEDRADAGAENGAENEDAGPPEDVPASAPQAETGGSSDRRGAEASAAGQARRP